MRNQHHLKKFKTHYFHFHNFFHNIHPRTCTYSPSSQLTFGICRCLNKVNWYMNLFRINLYYTLKSQWLQSQWLQSYWLQFHRLQSHCLQLTVLIILYNFKNVTSVQVQKLIYSLSIFNQTKHLWPTFSRTSCLLI